MSPLLVSSSLTAGGSVIKGEICSRHYTESLTWQLIDNFLSACYGNCVTFHECQADISGKTKAKSTTRFTFVILMICRQLNQYLWTWASQSKNKRASSFELGCYQETKKKNSFFVNLGRFYSISKWALWHCSVYYFEEGKMAPSPCTITLGTGTLSHNVHLHS